MLQVDVIEGDRESRGSTIYSTATRGIPPPLVTTEFTVEDNGELYMHTIHTVLSFVFNFYACFQNAYTLLCFL